MSQLVDFCTSATERLLLLLGWDRVHAPISENKAYSTEKKKPNGSLRARRSSAVKRPSKPEWEKDVTLTPVTFASAPSKSGSSSSNAWTATADAFDTAVTGTV
ncbi:MAG: hypothetical protein CMF51_02315 [Legionellales bacterium]|nr:hypothetical protein [Legionellales bacterium]